jgi:enamine deaminase RidA (YjgF/YER057c/UK114 family)
MKKKFLNPDSLPNWKHIFSQIVAVEGATKMVFIAGQVSVDNQNNLIGEGDLSLQARQAFKNLATALSDVGATTADVVKLTIYVKNYTPEDGPAVRQAFQEHFGQDELPVSTWLGVQSLASEGFLIEVDAIALLS